MNDEVKPSTKIVLQNLAKMKMKINADMSDYYDDGYGGYNPPPASNEVELRRQYPTLNEAWEQYQTILKLVQNADLGKANARK